MDTLTHIYALAPLAIKNKPDIIVMVCNACGKDVQVKRGEQPPSEACPKRKQGGIERTGWVNAGRS